MRTILQGTASECGLACLAMLAGHYGAHLELRELRMRFPSSMKGASLERLMSIADSLGLRSRAVRLEMQDLAKLRTPCILHWNLSHFVVLDRVGPRRVVILDPASGKRRLGHAEVSRLFTGVALELQPGPGFGSRPRAPATPLRSMMGRVTGLWRSLALVLVLSLALQVLVLVGPFFLQWVIDQVLVSADMGLLALLAAGFGVLVVLQAGVGLLRGWCVTFLSGSLGTQWAANVFGHLVRLPLGFFENRNLGDVVSRVGAVQAIQRTLTTSFVEALIDGLMALVTLAMMLLYSWKLACLTLLAVAAYAMLRWLTFGALRNGTEQQLEAGARQQGHLLESIRGIQSLKLAGQEHRRESAYRNLAGDAIGRDVQVSRMAIGFNSASQLVFGLERIAVIWIGARLTLDSVFSVGMLMAYLAYKDQFATRVNALIDKGTEFRMLRLHGERLADIVLEPPESDVDTGFEVDVESASLAVNTLSYRYAPGDPPVLCDCSFTVQAGESVAIVGPSGCGKTTLVKVMLGLLIPTSGSVEVDGRDIRKMGLRNFRRATAAVMQDDQLFAGSIAENIAFGTDTLDLARVVEAARLATIHDDIADMPMGYHSLIGDMGSSLSGGQKQRVILARALYRKPRILFLDEATSHLDVECERLVNQAIRQLQLTRIIIAHRPETIASADRVLRMRAGRVVDEERRTHPARAVDTVDP